MYLQQVCDVIVTDHYDLIFEKGIHLQNNFDQTLTFNQSFIIMRFCTLRQWNLVYTKITYSASLIPYLIDFLQKVAEWQLFETTNNYIYEEIITHPTLTCICIYIYIYICIPELPLIRYYYQRVLCQEGDSKQIHIQTRK